MNYFKQFLLSLSLSHTHTHTHTHKLACVKPTDLSKEGIQPLIGSIQAPSTICQQENIVTTPKSNQTHQQEHHWKWGC